MPAFSTWAHGAPTVLRPVSSSWTPIPDHPACPETGYLGSRRSGARLSGRICAPPLLSLQNISLTFGASWPLPPATGSVALVATVPANRRCCALPPAGSGRSAGNSWAVEGRHGEYAFLSWVHVREQRRLRNIEHYRKALIGRAASGTPDKADRLAASPRLGVGQPP